MDDRNPAPADQSRRLRRRPRPSPEQVRAAQDAIAAHLERVRDCETQIRSLQAEQAAAAAAFVDAQLALDEAQRCSSGPDQHRAMVTEVALARRVSTLSATRWLGDAWAVVRDTPATFAALAAGQLSWWAARSIATETAGLDRDTRLAVEAAVAAEAADLLPGQAAGLARRRVLAVDPAASAARAERARAERWVRIEEDESPAMALLTARLPAESAVAAWSALHDHARAAWADGAPGTVSTLMADTLVQRLTGLARADDVPICVDLVMTDAALLGGADTPAELSGFGPVPAAVARRLAAGSARWLRRLYADPADGVLTGADPRRRLFSGAARALVGLLDPHCRGPQCPAPVAEVDHVVAYADGGPTVVGNGQGLSKGCHRLRDHPGVAVSAAEHPHVLAWRLPSGAVCRTIPAPVLGHGSLSAAQVAHRHRLTHPDDQRAAAGTSGAHHRTPRSSAPGPGP